MATRGNQSREPGRAIVQHARTGAHGRKHTAEIVEREIAVLRAAGIGNFNVDLIAGLPGQTLESWNQSLEWVETSGCAARVGLHARGG